RRRRWALVAGRAAAVVALTADMAAEMDRLGYRGRVWLIGNSRRTDRFDAVDPSAAAARLRAEVGVADDVALVGLVGHLSPQKRPDRAVEVLAGLRAAGVPAHLVIAGTGPLRAMVEGRLAELGVRDHATFLGHRQDVEQVLGGLDLLVLTSDVEGMPGVLIEAQLAGCPVVTFPVGGAAEVVEDGHTGVVLGSAEVALMVEEVAALLGAPERLRAMGVAARERSGRFSAAVAASAYESRFAELLADVSSSTRPR
ncbi:MAG: glycosyl transferase, partial [Acidimicrobiales bacterium]|nr:glycosyl transferase [Acidimicrobiales bacterium]